MSATNLTLTPTPSVTIAAYGATPAESTTTGVIVLPDVRGLHPFYERLVDRFAEAGIAAVAIDYFGRTANGMDRAADFDFMSHVAQTTFAGQAEDVRAASRHLASPGGGGASRQYVIGFSFGGRMAIASTTLGLPVTGAVSFYGRPTGPGRNDVPAPVELASQITAPVLAFFGGADVGIDETAITEFKSALSHAGVAHEFVVYPNLPHSFFDRSADDYPGESEDAFGRILDFVGAGPQAR